MEQVWIDHCNICWMDTDHPDEPPACTKMYCEGSFDRVYHKDELDFVDGWAYIKGTAPKSSINNN